MMIRMTVATTKIIAAPIASARWFGVTASVGACEAKVFGAGVKARLADGAAFIGQLA